jgi:hypothetical protein
VDEAPTSPKTNIRVNYYYFFQNSTVVHEHSTGSPKHSVYFHCILQREVLCKEKKMTSFNPANTDLTIARLSLMDVD